MSLRSSRRFDLISLRPNQIVTARLTNSTGMNSNKRLEIDSRFNMVALFETAASRKISGPRRMGGVNPASRHGYRWDGFDIRAPLADCECWNRIAGFSG